MVIVYQTSIKASLLRAMEFATKIFTLVIVLEVVRSASVSPNVDPVLTPAPTPHPTHPMDDPEWIPPVGPRQELDKEFWIKGGARLLEEQLSRNSLNLNVARNVVIFIGDGMSIATQTAARMYMGGEELALSFEQFPYVGLAKTYCINYQVSDSSCTAAAILTGVKNNYGTISVSGHVPLMNCELSLQEENQLTSILRYAQLDGRATGIVTTTRITHATPAVAYAVAGARYWEDDSDTPAGCTDIASQLIHGEIGQNLTVVLGGGSRHFYPVSSTTVHGSPGRRQDGRLLIDEWLANVQARGESGAFVHDRSGLAQVRVSELDRLMGLFSANHMSYRLENAVQEPTLEEMTAKALVMVSKNERGYVLIVEAGRIDHAHHDNLAQLALDETVELHRAVQHVATATADRDDTLLLVTADHSHTLTMGGYPVRGNNILATGDFSRLDRMPFFTLSYANGMSYFEHTEPTGGRRNPQWMDSQRMDFVFPGTVPYEDETHGGDDVGVFARGPHAHLFSGVYEQHLIGHVLWYAACLGPSEETGHRPRSEACERRLAEGSSGGRVSPAAVVTAVLLAGAILLHRRQ